MPDRVAQIALSFFSLTTVVFWLATVRGAFEPSYQWGLFGLSGRGMRGDYWFPLIGAFGALAVLAGGWRCRRWAFTTLAAWSVLVLGAVIAAGVSNPNDFRFRGDTLGIDVSLVWLGPPLFAAGAAVSLLAAWRAYRRAPVAAAAWNVRNSRWLATLAAALPIQLVLLRFEIAGSLSDQIGVLVTVAQWLMVGQIFRSYST